MKLLLLTDTEQFIWVVLNEYIDGNTQVALSVGYIGMVL
jgi:hypothetical protein